MTLKPTVLQDLPTDLDAQGLPKHVAVIMDGNGRWAKRRGLPRIMGHRRGVDALKSLLRCCKDWGIDAPHSLCILNRELGTSSRRSRIFDDSVRENSPSGITGK